MSTTSVPQQAGSLVLRVQYTYLTATQQVSALPR